MPDSADRPSPHAPPKLVVSRPSEDVSSSEALPRSTLASRKRSLSESSNPHARSQAPDWIDVDDTQPRRRKRSSKRSTKRESPLSSSHRSRTSTDGEANRFLPSLTRILESTDSKPVSRPGTSGADSAKQREGSSTHRRRHRDDGSVGYRRPVKHRVGGVSRRSESTFKVNPSLLSVLTTLTRNSDSSSNTTITQRSYNRRGAESDRADRKRSDTESRLKKPTSPNVFDYMDPSSRDDGHDGASLYSSSSSVSNYEASDAGSSEQPGTPSSHSTFPSPTATRNSSLTGSVAELRRKYDSQYASSQLSARSNSQSPESTARSLRQSVNVKGIAEDPSEVATTVDSQTAGIPDEKERSNSISSRSSRESRREGGRRRQHVEAAPHYQHPSSTHHGQHLVDPVHEQHRSHSASSAGSAGSSRAYAQYMAMQQYQYASPPAYMASPAPQQAANGYAPHPDRPPVPDAPDLSQRTLAGYEQLAVELSNGESPVKPIYRKFEYLNHRILLHLQDELAEMEEKLRTYDEIVAQMESPPPPGQRAPASRRSDAFGGSDIHYQRTLLLGHIFRKTEQYNRALSGFQSMTKDSRPAEKEEISSYQDWLQKKTPIHEDETKFLRRDQDLISIRKTSEDTAHESAMYRPTKHAALTCIPVALMLPLLLFAIIPSLVGRLIVTALIAVGAFMVAATTRIRHLMPVNEWAVCGAAYVLVMAAIAGCIPQHSV